MTRTTRLIAASILAIVGAGSRLLIHAAPGQDQQRAPGTAASLQVPNSNFYVVQMAELPAVSYDGGLSGLPATKPGRGRKLDPDDINVVGYVSFLERRHDEALARAGGRKAYDYRYTFNGFAAELSDAQAEILRADPGVVSVTKDALQTIDTSFTPTFLGLDAPDDGLWNQLGGVAGAGEDIIIGMVDTGIWPESASFSDRTGTNENGKGGNLSYHNLPHWKGQCHPGEAFNASDCNQKLIAARHYNAAWGGDAGLKAVLPWEYASPRDYQGHGTHTTSIAGGNHNVPVSGEAALLGRISGIAPRARLSIYKALWSSQDGSTAGGFMSDLVAAIDQAVADGVDVINFSVEGTQTNFLDPVQVAFLFAADTGVFVAASAGNAGTSASVANPGPWVTTVAASTHSRTGTATAQLGTATYAGASLATPVGPAPLIDSTAAGLPGADPIALALCFSAADNGGAAVLDPAKVTGRIVVCDRGINPLVAKSLAVREAGGVGMILVNTVPNSLNAELHFVPTVHLSDTDRPLVKAYAATVGAVATINRAAIVFTMPAPFTATFSSRGPSQAGAGNLLKPDLIAPGQSIVAAVAPPGRNGRSFDVLSGTSMSSPHVAGLAALLKNLHQDWTPMMIKSALMTSATDVIDADVSASDTDPLRTFRQGAGHVAPNAAADPGLVYDAGINDWTAFLCGATTAVLPSACGALAAAGYSLDPSDLNMASISIGRLSRTKTVKRTVTNVGRSTATYTATTSGLDGFTVNVDPPTLTLAPGARGPFTLTLTRTTATATSTNAPAAGFLAGHLKWTDGLHAVRSRVLVRPVGIEVPDSVSGTGGPINYPATFAYSGGFGVTARGLFPALATTAVIADDPADSFTPIPSASVIAIPIRIAGTTSYARFSLFDANVSPASNLDLYVYKGTTLVGASTTATSNEEVNLIPPPGAGSYTVYVHGRNVPGSATFTLFQWQMRLSSSFNMTIAAPGSAIDGTTGMISLTFQGLTPGTKYLGSVVYSGPVTMPDPTLVRVDF